MQLFFKFFLHFGLLFCLSLVWGQPRNGSPWIISSRTAVITTNRYRRLRPSWVSRSGNSSHTGAGRSLYQGAGCGFRPRAAAPVRLDPRAQAALSAHHLDGRKHPRHRPHQGGTRLAERPVRRRENQTQPESRYRAEVMLDWKPNIYTCAHEQGSEANYHFSPERPSPC